MKHRRIVLVVLFFMMLSCAHRKKVRVNLPREIAFTKMFVMLPADEDGKFNHYSEIVQETLIREARKRKSLSVPSFDYTYKVLDKLDINPSDNEKYETFLSILEKTKSDSILVPILTKNSLTLRIYSALSGELFFEVNDDVREDFSEHSAKSMAELLLRRLFDQIPYDALVTRVDEKKVFINVGRRSGIIPGMKLTVFDIFDIIKKSGRSTYLKVPIALIKVVKSKNNSSVCKIVSHNEDFEIKSYSKISFLNFFKRIRKSDIEEK